MTKETARLVAGIILATAVLSVVPVSNVASAPPAKPKPVAPILFVSCSPVTGGSDCLRTQPGISGGFSWILGVAPSAGTIRSLSAISGVAPGTGFSYTVTVYKNSSVPVVGALSCTISDTQNSCSNTTNSFTVAAGDTIEYEFVSNGSPNGTHVLGGVAFESL